MGLPEKVIPRRYHALDNDWTPLSRNPGWLSNAAHRFRHYMKRNRFAWFHRLVTYRQKLLPTNYKLIDDCDKSFADDLVASRYCKHESSLCATICWDFSCVPTICSSHCVWRYWCPSLTIGQGGAFSFNKTSLLKNLESVGMCHFQTYQVP